VFINFILLVWAVSGDVLSKKWKLSSYSVPGLEISKRRNKAWHNERFSE
jgi:hypothetical protein